MASRTTAPKPKAETNGHSKITAELLLGRKRPERTVPIDVGGATVEVRLRAISGNDYDDLVVAHPRPEDATHIWPFDVDTFAPALIAACMVEPELTLEQAAQIWAEWENDARQQLWDAALEVNSGWSTRGAVKKDSTAPGS